MSTWLASFDTEGVVTTATVEAEDLNSANDAALALIPEGGTLLSVSRISEPPAALTGGIQKLVDLGLTAEEATAVAGVPETQPLEDAA